MMKKLGLLLATILVLALPAQTADQQFVYKNLTLGTGSTVVAFGFQAQAVLVRNRNASGGNVLYVDWTGAAVTAADDEVDPGAAVSLSGASNTSGGTLTFGSIAVACATGTCNVLIVAVK